MECSKPIPGAAGLCTVSRGKVGTAGYIWDSKPTPPIIIVDLVPHHNAFPEVSIVHIYHWGAADILLEVHAEHQLLYSSYCSPWTKSGHASNTNNHNRWAIFTLDTQSLGVRQFSAEGILISTPYLPSPSERLSLARTAAAVCS